MTCDCDTMLCGVHEKILEQNLHIVAGDLGGIPLMDDLNITVTKMDTMRPQFGFTTSGSDEQPLIFNLGASDAAHELVQAVHRVARQMLNHYNHLMLPCDTSITGLARWLLLLPNLLREHPNVIRMAEALNSAVISAHLVMDRPEDRTYLGPCRTALEGDETCDTSLYAVEGQRSIRCVVCRVWWEVEELREYLVSISSDQVVTASDAVGLVNTTTGRELSADAIRALKRRGRLHPVGKDRHRHDLFRVGDIIELVKERENGN